MDNMDETAAWAAGPGDDGPGEENLGDARPEGPDHETAGLPGVGRIALSKKGELACRAVLVLVGALYVVLMVVSYANARTALLEAGETEELAALLPVGFDVAGTVLVALSLVLAVKESRGQLVARVYGVVLVATSAGIGAWYGHQVGGGWFSWFVAAHALMAVTLAVFAESVAWLLRARIDAAVGVERVPMVLCLTNPGAWREANMYRLRHRSPISSALVVRSEKIKAVSRVVEAAQEDAGYKGAKAKKVRAAIMRACRDGTLPVEAIERACENGLDETASRRLLVDAAKAMMASTATVAISGDDPLTELLGGNAGGDPGAIRGRYAPAPSGEDAGGGGRSGGDPGACWKAAGERPQHQRRADVKHRRRGRESLRETHGHLRHRLRAEHQQGQGRSHPENHTESHRERHHATPVTPRPHRRRGPRGKPEPATPPQCTWRYMDKIKTKLVTGGDLRAGDVLACGDEVTEVHHDPEGTWIETFRGNCGYADGQTWRVQLPRPPR
ncbi:DUF2637 domain-containing protein [Actinomadura madurae]|uniref:DUF2637 domain-containing protein n=1 Tax=Actinomadura madurae TaxID=1993 RepID=UPI0020268255|nr:DUF2637 domain-containing protein [Actinomadura madurae]URN01225.1 DUF2637 domain-containing protein [Actinomadura madurae]